MTVSPEQPKLKDSQEEGFKVLIEPHLTFINLWFGFSLKVLIGDGFITDGASVPYNIFNDKDYGLYLQNYIVRKYPTLSTRFDLDDIWNKIIGSPWDMPRLLAAIVHDALYVIKWKFRWICDIIYKKILVQNSYDRIRTDIEYTCISLVGWRHWNKKTKEEVENNKRIVKVEIVKNKDIPEIIRQIKG